MGWLFWEYVWSGSKYVRYRHERNRSLIQLTGHQRKNYSQHLSNVFIKAIWPITCMNNRALIDLDHFWGSNWNSIV
jgi:hypothetical protein